MQSARSLSRFYLSGKSRIECMAVAREEGEGSHVLLLALAVESPINPMLSLGKRLVSKGLRVPPATTEATRQCMLKANMPPCSVRLEFFPHGLPRDFDRTNPENPRDIVLHLERHGPTNLSVLIQSISARNAAKFSCIINNPSVPWVANVAEDHGIPCAMLCT